MTPEKAVAPSKTEVDGLLKESINPKSVKRTDGESFRKGARIYSGTVCKTKGHS
jgi:hypothetical protein